MDRKKILVVENNEDNRRILIHRLRQIEDFEVFEATHGQEALEVVRRESVDLIFMDLKLPLLSGWETTRRIRTLQGPVREVPIIAYTACALMGDEERALEAGCTDYIAKPVVDPGLIRKKVERYLNKA